MAGQTNLRWVFSCLCIGLIAGLSGTLFLYSLDWAWRFQNLHHETVCSSVLAALGFSAVFAGAAQVPITCAILSCEIFGWQLAPYAIVACFMSYYFSGDVGIYNGQVRSAQRKLSAIGEWWQIIIQLIRKSLKRSS